MHKNLLPLPFQFPGKKPVHGIFCVRIKLFSTERFIFFFNLFTVGESTPHAGRRIVFSVGTEIQTVIAVRLFQFSVKTAEGFPSMAGIIFCGEPSDRCPGFDDFFEVNFPDAVNLFQGQCAGISAGSCVVISFHKYRRSIAYNIFPNKIQRFHQTGLPFSTAFLQFHHSVGCR